MDSNKDSESKSSGKSNVRAYNKNLICPERECGITLHSDAGTREYLVDVNAPFKCKRCGKVVDKALVEASTDKLTPEETAKLA